MSQIFISTSLLLHSLATVVSIGHQFLLAVLYAVDGDMDLFRQAAGQWFAAGIREGNHLPGV